MKPGQVNGGELMYTSDCGDGHKDTSLTWLQQVLFHLNSNNINFENIYFVPVYCGGDTHAARFYFSDTCVLVPGLCGGSMPNDHW